MYTLTKGIIKRTEYNYPRLTIMTNYNNIDCILKFEK